jgi:polyphenol oxidase
MMVETPKQFYGGKFCNVELDDEGKKKHNVTGSLENGGHNSAHIWLGDPGQMNQDMGDLSTAARDPIFYSNHSNVDRMWHIYSTKLGGGLLPYKEWLDTSFVFYNAQKWPVRITVRDVLDVGKLGYMFEESGKLPWMGKRPKPAANIQRPPGLKGTQTNSSYPMTLKKGERQYLRVERPERARASGGSSKKVPEALVVDVTIDPCEYVKFDVLVNVPKGQEKKVGPQNSEFAGSFTQVPHGGGIEMKTQMVSYQFAVRELLEDLKCGKDSQLDITLVLVEGNKVVIDAARIEVL